MKGLLYKELKALYRQKAFIIMGIFAVLQIALAITVPSSGMNPMIILNSLILVRYNIEIMSNDERYGWNVLEACMPYKKSQAVASKYLLGLITAGLATVVSTFCLLIQLVMGTPDYEAFCSSVMMIAVSLASNAILLPFVYGRVISLVTSNVIFVLIGMTAYISAMFITGIVSNLFIDGNTGWFIGMAVFGGIAIVVYAVSWALSIAVYKKRGI